MSAIIQCIGFTVEPLGQLFSIGEPWMATTPLFSARVTIQATGESQLLQTFGQTQDDANLRAMEYGNKRVGNVV